MILAVLVAFLFQVALVASTNGLPELGYLAFCLLLSATVGLVLAFVSDRLGLPKSVALAAWASLNASFFFPAWRNVGLAIALGLSTVAVLGLRRGGGVREAAAHGAAVGSALCLTFIVFPRLLLLFWPGLPEGLARDAVRVLTFVLLVATVPLAQRFAPRRLRAGAVLPILSVLVAVIVLTPRTFDQRPWDHQRRGSATGPRTDAGREHPSVFVIVMDTVRADQLSLYGFERDTSPALREFVARTPRARVFPFAFSPAPWTVPAHASLFTGLLPSDHGAHSGNVEDARRSGTLPGLTADRTLAEVYRSRGYRTAGVFANIQLGVTAGLERGFDVFYQPRRTRPLFLLAEKMRARLAPWLFADPAKHYPDASSVSRDVLSFVDSESDRPVFVLANYMEAHQPYAPRKPFAGKFSERSSWNAPVVAHADDSDERMSWARDRYHEEIASLDESLGQLLRELETRGILQSSWVVITSDHGEAFGEHETVNHGNSVYNEQVRIPLIVCPPLGVALPEAADAVGLIDVATTLAALVDPEAPLGVGRDLRHPLGGSARPVQIEFFGNPSEVRDENVRWWGKYWNTPASAVVWSQRKLIDLPGKRELYDLESDPGELQDLSEDLSDHVKALAPLLPPLQSTPTANRRVPTPDELEQLRSLGYLDD